MHSNLQCALDQDPFDNIATSHRPTPASELGWNRVTGEFHDMHPRQPQSRSISIFPDLSSSWPGWNMPSRRDARGPPSLSRSTRSWTDHDGNHFTINSFSSGTGVSFGTMTGSSGEHLESSYSTSAAPRRTSLFSNAFSLVEDIVTMQQQQRAAFKSTSHSRKPRKQHVRADFGSETEDEDDGLAYGQHSLGHRKSVLSRIKERLREGKRSQRKEACASSDREEPPAPSPRAGRRANVYRADPVEPLRFQQHSRPSPTHIVVEHEDDECEDVDSDNQSRISPSLEHTHLEALSDTIEHERSALRACKKRLEQASRQSNSTSSLLQRVIDDIKGHERALIDATDCLSKAKLKQRRSGIPQAQTRPRPQTYHPRHSHQGPNRPSLDGHYFPAFAGFEFEPHTTHSQHISNVFGTHEHPNPFGQFQRPQSFGDFEHFFGHVPQSMADDLHSHFHLFDVPDINPQRSQQRRARQSQGPPPPHRRSHQVPTFTPPSTPPLPQPPSSTLKSAEAQRLFQSYNVRWNTLLPTDAAVPYPARDLQASSLSVRTSIWAPRIKTNVSMWNEETVMQANAQAFYLGVVGLKPEYAETSHGQIDCGFEKTSASPEQVKQLVHMLKKEKARWHSDRLGRRNGGVLGGVPNEVLQKDVRARAVFHAVCELMDRALE